MHGVQALLRGLHLLQIVAESEPLGIQLSEAADLAGLSRPTAHRLLAALTQERFVQQTIQRGRYVLGHRMATLSSPAPDNIDWGELTDQTTRRLAAQTQDVILFAIRNGSSTLVISRVEGEFPVRTHVVRVGDRHPPGVGTAWISILAGLPDEEVDAMLREETRRLVNFPRFTNTLIRELIADAQATGYSLNRGLIFEGAWAMGVPVRDLHGRPVAAVTVAAIEERLVEDRRQWLFACLSEAAQDIREQLKRIS